MYRHHYPNDPGMHTAGDLGRRDYETSPYPASHEVDDGSWAFACRGRLQRGSAFRVLVGSLLVTASLCVLSWNELRAVRVSRSLDEGIRSVRALSTTDVTFDELNGHLVYCQGRLTCGKAVSDSEYGVVVSAAKLRRTVEMYQWVETEHGDERDDGLGSAEGTVIYTYEKRWLAELVPSSGFYSPHQHRNPESMTVKTATFVADEVAVGNILLSPGLVDQISNFHDIQLKELPENHNDLHLIAGYLYHSSRNAAEPEVGDLRVRFAYAGSCLGETADTVSIIAKQAGRMLEHYETYAGDNIEILSEGSHTVQELFSRGNMINTMQLLVLRALGWLISFAGFTCLPPGFAALVSRLPLGRDLAATGRHTMNAGLATSVTLTAVASCWLLRRPGLCALALTLATLPVLLPQLVARVRRSTIPLRR